MLLPSGIVSACVEGAVVLCLCDAESGQAGKPYCALPSHQFVQRDAVTSAGLVWCQQTPSDRVNYLSFAAGDPPRSLRGGDCVHCEELTERANYLIAAARGLLDR
jgi:hypothetical protein